MISEGGRMVAARAMLASPARGRSTAGSFGFLARRVAPNRRRNSFGLKPSFSQPLALKGAETGVGTKAAGSTGLAPPPSSDPAMANGEQLVGLSEKLGRSSFTATERTSSRAPP